MTTPADTDPTARRRARKLAAVLAVKSTVGFGVLFYAFSVLAGDMAGDLGWENATLSAGLSTGLVVSGLVAPLVGGIIDRRGAREVMIWGSVIGGGGVVVWALATSLPVYLVAWAVIGLGMAMTLYEPAFAAVARHAPARRRQSIMTITLVGALASTIFVPITGALADAWGWRNALLVLAAVHVLITLPLAWFGIPRHGTVVAGESRRAERGSNGPEHPSDRPAPTLRSSAQLRRLVLALALGKASTLAVGAHLVLFLVAQGTPASTAAVLAGGVGLAKVGGRFVVGLAARYLKSRILAAASFGLQGLGLLLSLVGDSLIANVTMVVLFGLGAGAITVVKPLYVADLFGVGDFGLIAGRASRVVRFSDAFTPAAIGGLVTLTGSYGPPWMVLITACVLGMLVLPKEPA